MQTQQIKQIIIQELPTILQHDREIQDLVVQLSRRHLADREETESRFDRLLDELRRDREEQSRKWDQQNKNGMNRAKSGLNRTKDGMNRTESGTKTRLRSTACWNLSKD